MKETHRAPNTTFDSITQAHGSLVTDGQNIFYDLSNDSSKPFWGHGHPLSLKHNKIPKNITSYTPNSIKNDLQSKDLFEMTCAKYIKTVLVDGGRIDFIQERIKTFTNKFDNISIDGLNILIHKETDQDDIKSANNYCLYLNSTNIVENNLFLNFQTSYTNSQLEDCLKRVESYLGEIICS